MASPTLTPPEPRTTPESPLLAVFALLVVVSVVAIGLMLALPGTVTMLGALGTVMGSAVGVTVLLARTLGKG